MSNISITYLPPPLRIKNSSTNQDFSFSTEIACTIAFGILSSYTPKTFLILSSLIVVYHIHRFNQLVSGADASQLQTIYTWTLTACKVMVSLGTVWVLCSLTHVWFSYSAFKQFEMINSVTNLARGILEMGLGSLLIIFSKKGNELMKKKHWIAMEDYVQNYPLVFKQFVTSSYLGQFYFYASAMTSVPFLKFQSSGHGYPFNQFCPLDRKIEYLNSYFSNEEFLPSIPEAGSARLEWALAIHQLQQLPLERQFIFGPRLLHIVQASTQEQRDQLPHEVKVILINERLKSFVQIPDSSEARDTAWDTCLQEFHQLDLTQQSKLGVELYRLFAHSQLESMSSDVKLAILKACFVRKGLGTDLSWCEKNLATLPVDLKKEFESYLLEHQDRLTQGVSFKMMEELKKTTS